MTKEDIEGAEISKADLLKEFLRFGFISEAEFKFWIDNKNQLDVAIINRIFKLIDSVEELRGRLESFSKRLEDTGTERIGF